MNRTERTKLAIVEELAKDWTEEETDPTKRELGSCVQDGHDVDPSEGTFNRAMQQLRMRRRIVSTPRGYVRFGVRDPKRCVACGERLEEREGVRGRCGNEDCIQPQHEVRCQAGCRTVYAIEPHPRVQTHFLFDHEFAGPESPSEYEHGAPERRACPGCGDVWEPPTPWPFGRWAVTDPEAYDVLADALPDEPPDWVDDILDDSR